jgi:hypothetical protein
MLTATTRIGGDAFVMRRLEKILTSCARTCSAHEGIARHHLTTDQLPSANPPNNWRAAGYAAADKRRTFLA